MRDFGVGEVLAKSWGIYKKNFWLLLGVLLVSGIVSYVPTAIGDLQDRGQLQIGFLAGILSLLFWLFGQLIGLGETLINLKLVDGKRAVFNDLFSCSKLLFSGVIATIAYLAVIIAGFILLIIPGIWLAIRLQFFRYLIVDRGMNPFQALAESWRMTKGKVWKLLGWIAVLVILNILGAITLGVGLIITIPVSMVAMTEVYRKLEFK